MFVHQRHAYVDEAPGSTLRANDLADFYPPSGIAGQSRNGAGGAAAPGAVAAGGRGLSANVSASGSIGGSPALAMIGIVALALFLLHLE